MHKYYFIPDDLIYEIQNCHRAKVSRSIKRGAQTIYTIKYNHWPNLQAYRERMIFKFDLQTDLTCEWFAYSFSTRSFELCFGSYEIYIHIIQIYGNTCTQDRELQAHPYITKYMYTWCADTNKESWHST